MPDISHINGLDGTVYNLKDNEARSVVIPLTLASASWQNNSITVSNNKLIANGYAYIVAPASSSYIEYGKAQVYADDVVTNGYITFYCGKVPTTNLSVNLIRMKLADD